MTIYCWSFVWQHIIISLSSPFLHSLSAAHIVCLLLETPKQKRHDTFSFVPLFLRPGSVGEFHSVILPNRPVTASTLWQCLLRLTKCCVNPNRTKWKKQQCCNFTHESHRVYRTIDVEVPLLCMHACILSSEPCMTFLSFPVTLLNLTIGENLTE